MFRIRGEQKFFEFLAVFCSNIAVFFKLVHFKRETDRHGGQESKSVLEWNEKAVARCSSAIEATLIWAIAVTQLAEWWLLTIGKPENFRIENFNQKINQYF